MLGSGAVALLLVTVIGWLVMGTVEPAPAEEQPPRIMAAEREEEIPDAYLFQHFLEELHALLPADRAVDLAGRAGAGGGEGLGRGHRGAGGLLHPGELRGTGPVPANSRPGGMDGGPGAGGGAEAG